MLPLIVLTTCCDKILAAFPGVFVAFIVPKYVAYKLITTSDNVYSPANSCTIGDKCLCLCKTEVGGQEAHPYQSNKSAWS